MSSVLELVQNDREKVVIKVNAKDPLTVALNPEFNSEMAYITVTKGKKHIMTIIKEDGTSWSFHWGGNSCTMVSDSVLAMKNKVIAFIRENGIAYGLTDYPTKATIFYNDYFKSWQLTLERGREEDHIWYKDAANETDMILYARKFINVEGWGQRKAQTGIKVWEAVF